MACHYIHGGHRAGTKSGHSGREMDGLKGCFMGVWESIQQNTFRERLCRGHFLYFSLAQEGSIQVLSDLLAQGDADMEIMRCEILMNSFFEVLVSFPQFLTSNCPISCQVSSLLLVTKGNKRDSLPKVN